MKKGKLLAFILALAMCLGVLTAFVGCANDGDKLTGTLKVAGLKGGYGDEYWKQIKAGFEAANPGVTVDLTIEAAIEDTIKPQIMAGAGPDVLYLATQRKAGLTESLISSGSLLDLTDLLEEKVYNEDVKLKDRVLSGFMGKKITDPGIAGKHIMLPLFFSMNGLYHNADMFYENNGNGTYDGVQNGKYELPATFAEFKALGESLGANKTGSVGSPSLWTYPTAGYLDTFIPGVVAASAGDAKFRECLDYKDGIWEDASVKKGFDFLGEIAPYVDATTIANANNQNFRNNQQLVIDGKALFMPNGDWVVGEMAESTPEDFKWGFTTYPAVDKDGQGYAPVSVEQIHINKNSPKVELAKKFLLYVYSQDGLKFMAKHSNGGLVPAKTFDTLAKAEGKNLDSYKGIYDGSASAMTNQFASASAEDVDWKSVYCATYDEVVKGTKSVAEWITELEAASDKLRANLK